MMSARKIQLTRICGEDVIVVCFWCNDLPSKVIPIIGSMCSSGQCNYFLLHPYGLHEGLCRTFCADLHGGPLHVFTDYDLIQRFTALTPTLPISTSGLPLYATFLCKIVNNCLFLSTR